MENTNEVNIDWGTWDEPKSSDLTNQDQTPPSNFPNSWGELSPEKEQTTISEESQEIETSTESQEIETSTPSFEDYENEFNEWKYSNSSKYSYLGVTKNIELNPELYLFHYDNEKALEDIDLENLTPFDDDNKFKIESSPNSELSQILGSIQEIGSSKGLSLKMFYLVKNVPNASDLNIFSGKPQMNFIYIIKGDKNSGNIVLDLSALGGPSQKIMDTQNGMLILFEGWVPYRITKNLSDTNLLVIAGNFN